MTRRLAAAVLAVLLVGSPALAREVHFAGYDWYVRDYPGGPGPNIWNPDDVFVDDEGLHLFIANTGGVWTSTEVVMLGPPLGFGTYEFEVSGRIDIMDRNAVLGLFNYPGSDDIGPGGTNEIDVEITPWGDRQNPNRLNWTVHPAVPGPRAESYHAPLDLPGGASTYRFTWSPESVDYLAHAGYPDSPDYRQIDAWTFAPADFTTRIPQQPLVVHLNLWLLNGIPEGNDTVEVIIRNFRYSPLN
ncbi:MAG: hypothetical protein EOP22_13375 [Hyphomicrobiales bacterium]|nr:MAG: hypothetical protein EOP22_13375 [Hyphomicrobiales bacterium]